MITIATSSKNHAVLKYGNEELCTLYGSDWRKRMNLLNSALTLLHTVNTSDLKGVNKLVKEIRAKK